MGTEMMCSRLGTHTYTRTHAFLSYTYIQIAAALPSVCQTFLMSATLNSEVDELQKVILHNPVRLTVREEESISSPLLTGVCVRVSVCVCVCVCVCAWVCVCVCVCVSVCV